MPEPPKKPSGAELSDKGKRRSKLSSMSDVPSKSSSSTKATATSAASESSKREGETREPGLFARLSGSSNTIWALIAGLAIGFAVGREAHRFGLSSTQATSESTENAGPRADIAPEANKGPKAYGSMAEFPSGWVKAADLGERASLLASLTDAQKTTVMQALNERTCNCGCAFGTLAQCLQKDPNCPNSPNMAKIAIDLAKQGKGLAEILAAIDAKDSAPKKAAEPPPPPKPQYIELAAWNPRLGPNPAKVTVVEFSDFQ